MQAPKLTFIYGIGLWVTLVIASLILRVYETGNSPLFESLKFVVLAGATVAFVVMYVQKVKKTSAREGLIVGGSWLLITIGLDLVLYALGLFNLTLNDYLVDVALSYYIMPIIAALIMARLRAN